MKNTVKKLLPRSVKNALKWLLRLPSPAPEPQKVSYRDAWLAHVSSEGQASNSGGRRPRAATTGPASGLPALDHDYEPLLNRLREDIGYFGTEFESEKGFFNYFEHHPSQVVKKEHYIHKDVLDLGCGVGGASAFHRGGRMLVWGIDPFLNDDLMNKLAQLPRTQFIPQPLKKELVGDQRFDLIYARFVTEHIQDCGETFRMIFDLLKPGGRFVGLHGCYYGPMGGHDHAFIMPSANPKVIESKAVPCWTNAEKCAASVEYRQKCEQRHDWTVKEWHLTPEDCTKCTYYHRAQVWGHLLYQDSYPAPLAGSLLLGPNAQQDHGISTAAVFDRGRLADCRMDAQPGR